MAFLKKLKFFLEIMSMLWIHRKEFDYCKRTGKVPLCGCNKFLETDNCEHLEKLKKEVDKILKELNS